MNQPPFRTFTFVGGKLALDFVNAMAAHGYLSWQMLIGFMEASGITGTDRGVKLLALPESDPVGAEGLLLKAQKLGMALRRIFAAQVRKQRVAAEWIEPINEVLGITEGHDELVAVAAGWRLEFVARRGGLDWLLAAIARSGAEILSEGAQARVRQCANPHCGLYFYDTSRTHQRRWCSMAVCGNRSKVAAFARRRISGRHSGM